MEHRRVTLAVVVILGLAAYRLTRVLAVDTITDPFRAALYEWAWEGPIDHPSSRGTVRGWIYELALCSQCLGVWVALAAVAVYGTVTSYPSDFGAWLIDVFAVAGVQSLAASVTGRLEQ